MVQQARWLHLSLQNRGHHSRGLGTAQKGCPYKSTHSAALGSQTPVRRSGVRGEDAWLEGVEDAPTIGLGTRVGCTVAREAIER